MRLTNNLQEDKYNAKKQAKLLALNSPDTSNMIEIILDSRTTVYYKVGTPIEKINSRVEAHKKKLCTPTVELSKTEEVYIPYTKKNNSYE